MLEQNYSALLQSHKISPTRQRCDVAKVLLESSQHLSAEQIFSCLNRVSNMVSRATVYNTLKLFVAKHLIREVIVDPNIVFYDANTQPHHHFYHVDKGTLVDICSEQITLSKLPLLPKDTQLDSIDIIIRIRDDH